MRKAAAWSGHEGYETGEARSVMAEPGLRADYRSPCALYACNLDRHNAHERAR